MKTRLTLLSLATASIPATAFAHPGHGTTEPESWVHYLTEPVHVAMFAAAVSLGVVVVGGWRRARARRDRRS